MTNKVKVCIDKVLPQDKLMEAARRAIAENPSNAPSGHVKAPMGVSAASPFFIALVTGKKWKNGRTVPVGFMGGQQKVIDRIKEQAKKWRESANIDFDFTGNASPTVRIAFTDSGSWSYLGTDALTIPMHEPTMNYGWLTPDGADEEYERVVCHEFGHALAAIHEHSHPEGNIPWNKPAVYAYYATMGWGPDEVDSQVFERYSREMTQFSQYDPKSIMHYPVPKELTTDGTSVGWNTKISESDVAFMRSAYPREQPGVGSLEIGAAPRAASIGAHGEEDVFELKVTKRARHRIQTTGSTDLVMTIAGPDNPSRIVAEDDDSGVGSNPRITAWLDPGTYTIRVRHYRPAGVGEYRIQATKT